MISSNHRNRALIAIIMRVFLIVVLLNVFLLAGPLAAQEDEFEVGNELTIATLRDMVIEGSDIVLEERLLGAAVRVERRHVTGRTADDGIVEEDLAGLRVRSQPAPGQPVRGRGAVNRRGQERGQVAILRPRRG